MCTYTRRATRESARAVSHTYDFSTALRSIVPGNRVRARGQGASTMRHVSRFFSDRHTTARVCVSLAATFSRPIRRHACKKERERERCFARRNTALSPFVGATIAADANLSLARSFRFIACIRIRERASLRERTTGRSRTLVCLFVSIHNLTRGGERTRARARSRRRDESEKTKASARTCPRAALSYSDRASPFLDPTTVRNT